MCRPPKAFPAGVWLFVLLPVCCVLLRWLLWNRGGATATSIVWTRRQWQAKALSASISMPFACEFQDSDEAIVCNILNDVCSTATTQRQAATTTSQRRRHRCHEDHSTTTPGRKDHSTNTLSHNDETLPFQCHVFITKQSMTRSRRIQQESAPLYQLPAHSLHYSCRNIGQVCALTLAN